MGPDGVRVQRGCRRRDGGRARLGIGGRALLVGLCVVLSQPVAAGDLDGLWAATSSEDEDPQGGGAPSGGDEPGEPGELVERRTARSRTFVREDERHDTVIAAGPINYQDASGAWRGIDNRLVADGQGGYGYRNAANRYRLRLPTDLGRTPVRFAAHGAWVQWRLPDASGGAPEVSGRSAVYGEALPGVDVAYRALADRVEEELVLADSSADSEFVFEVEVSEGLAAEENPRGGIDFVDAAGSVAFAFAAPFMFDSAQSDDGLGARSEAVRLEIAEDSPGLVVRLAADREWLEDPARVFPVVIDPTVRFDQADQDTFIAEGQFADYNYGADDELLVGVAGGGEAVRSLLRFPVEAELPVGEPVTVDSATLELHLKADDTPAPTEGVAVHRLKEPWVYDAATWNARTSTETWASPGGTFDGSAEATNTTLDETTAGWEAWDVTDLTQDWVDGAVANDGVLLKVVDETDVGNILYFESNQATSDDWPRLTVTYTPQADASSWDPAISADGRFVAFWSYASNLVADDSNGWNDVFVKDRDTGAVDLVSVSSSGAQGNHSSRSPSISGDGRYVAFQSYASNLVTDDTNGGWDVFVHDRVTGLTRRASESSSGAQADDTAWESSISMDGEYVAYSSYASNLVDGDTNGTSDVFVSRREGGVTTRASVDTAGGDPNGQSRIPSIDAAGEFVSFYSDASDLVSDDGNGATDVFVSDRTGTTGNVRVSVTSSGGESDDRSFRPSISHDGRVVAFESLASNLDADDTNGLADVYVHDIDAATTTWASPVAGGGNSKRPSLSGDGRYVAYHTSEDLLSYDSNGSKDVYEYEVATGESVLLSQDDFQPLGDCSSIRPSVSGDGASAAFTTCATTFDPDDRNDTWDIYVHDWEDARTVCKLTRISDPDPDSDPGDTTDPPAVPEAQTIGTGTGHTVRTARLEADPVNTATGAYVTSATDAALPGVGAVGFAFARTYNSNDATSGPLGPGWSHAYDPSLAFPAAGQVRFTAEDGQQLEYATDGDSAYLAPPGGRSRLSPLENGWQLTRRDQVAYRFDDSGRLTRLEDRNDQGLDLAYDTDGQLASITDSTGRVITLGYDAAGLLTSLALPDGRSVAYAYTSGRLTSVTDPTGATTSYSYDADERLAEVTDANGNRVVTNTYDSAGRVSDQTDATGNVGSFAWDATTQTSTYTDARGNTWTDVYDDNVLLETTDPLGHTTSYGYDGDLNRTRVTDPRGFTTAYGYDTAGNPTSITAPEPLAYHQAFTWDADDNLTIHTDGRDQATTFAYDTAGNLTDVTHPDGTTAALGYDAAGQVTSATDERGETTTFAYDAAGNLTEVTDPAGGTASFSYDSSGRMTAAVDPRGNESGADPADYTTTYAWDAADRLTDTTDPLGATTSFAYDAVGNRTETTDANTNTTGYAYDAANRLAEVTAADLATTAYAYDTVGNLVSRTDANGHVTSYAYDAADRLSSVTDPLDNTWGYAYDPAGNRTRTEDPIGVVNKFFYDVVGRLSGIDYGHDATADVGLAYDANSNRVEMTDGAGATSYTYDARDRLTETNRGADVFTYAYDAAGNVTTRGYPDESVTEYSYDPAGRLADTTLPTGGTTKYSYDAAGRLDYTRRPDGTNTERSWDTAGRLTQVETWDAMFAGSVWREYTYDAVGNPLTMRGLGGVDYTYDARNRITDASYSNGDFVGFAYDAVGNRTTKDTPDGTTSYSYDAADQLTNSSGPDGDTSYTYDAAGRQTQAGVRSFAWDAAGRLVSTTQDSATTEYAYDGDGQRVSVTADGATTAWLWDINTADGLGRLALERDTATGETIRRHSYDHGPMAVNADHPHYTLRGRLGSVIGVVDAGSGIIERDQTYYPYGELRSVKTGGAADTPLRFTGQYQDPTGDYHLRARQYNPETGRFRSRDPLAPALTDPYVASYAYARNRPTVLTDPSGLAAEGNTRLALHPDAHYSPAGGTTLTLSPPYDINLTLLGLFLPPNSGLHTLLADTNGSDAAGVEFRPDTSHIFRNAPGHLAEDTPENRALLRDTVRSENFAGSRGPGGSISLYRELLPDGRQVWVEVRNGVEITNGGVNRVPRR